MRASIKTLPRTADTRRRRRKKEPSPTTQLRVQWLEWLVATYGPDAAAEWQEPPVDFDEWRRERSLKAHEAA